MLDAPAKSTSRMRLVAVDIATFMEPGRGISESLREAAHPGQVCVEITLIWTEYLSLGGAVFLHIQLRGIRWQSGHCAKHVVKIDKCHFYITFLGGQ
jgi:hypothetical protein